MAKIARVLGPYRNGSNWRLVVFDEKGQRMARLAETREEAEKFKAELLRLFEDRSAMTVGTAFTEWLDEKRQAGIKPLSIRTIQDKLLHFLPLDSQLGEISPQRAAQLYQEETRRVGRYGVLRPKSHHVTLSLAKGLFAWAVEREYIRENPFAKIKPIGKANAGKPQLREDEARKLHALLVNRAQAGEQAPLALLVQLNHGLRSSEVLALRVRDLDAGGTVLVVDGTKTKNSRRRIEIASTVVRELLTRRCAALQPDDLIFQTSQGKAHHLPYLHKALVRFCRAASVPIVCPHSLRGLYSSLAVAQGESSRAVANALGHGSDAITKKHYINPEAMQTGHARRMASKLEGPSNSSIDSLAKALAALDVDQMQALMASVAELRKSS